MLEKPNYSASFWNVKISDLDIVDVIFEETLDILFGGPRGAE